MSNWWMRFHCIFLSTYATLGGLDATAKVLAGKLCGTPIGGEHTLIPFDFFVLHEEINKVRKLVDWDNW